MCGVGIDGVVLGVAVCSAAASQPQSPAANIPDHTLNTAQYRYDLNNATAL